MSTTRDDPPACFYEAAGYEVSESIGHMLVHLMTAMRREVEARMAEHGLTDAQWKPLWIIGCGRADSAFELSRMLDIDAGATTRTLDRLEAKGLVERVRSETDRRVVHLRLTAAGETAAAVIPGVLASVNNDFLRGFSEKEFVQLKKLVQRMAANGQALRQPEAAA